MGALNRYSTKRPTALIPIMSSSRAPQDIPSEGDSPRNITYDPTDPFWQDTEDDNDDMDYFPAVGDSQNEEDGDTDTQFHGRDAKKLEVFEVWRG